MEPRRHYETVVEARRGGGMEVLGGGDLMLSRSYDRQTWFPKHRSIITISSDFINYTYVYVYPPPRAFVYSSFLHASCITCITRIVQFFYYFFTFFFTRRFYVTREYNVHTSTFTKHPVPIHVFICIPRRFLLFFFFFIRVTRRHGKPMVRLGSATTIIIIIIPRT